VQVPSSQAGFFATGASLSSDADDDDSSSLEPLDARRSSPSELSAVAGSGVLPPPHATATTEAINEMTKRFRARVAPAMRGLGA
jgi:hypothetical protein